MQLFGLAILASSCNVLIITKQDINVMYNPRKYIPSKLTGCEKVEGEPIEHKIQRIMRNKEPIKDGAPLIYTERKDGIIAAYNIRTDRFEIAAEAMDVVNKTRTAMSQGKGLSQEKEDTKVINLNNDGGAESTHGTKTGSSSSNE